jgi:UDP-2,4-diacetamido-2,4,6-trideoxy-beta-L-altropyranose hydrolase
MDLLIRADADKQIGNGHIMRCLALGQACKDQGGSVTFISCCDSNRLRQRILDEGFELIPIEKPYPELFDLNMVLKNISSIKQQKLNDLWLVLDGYQFNSEYQRAIKEAGHRLLVVDDTAHLDYYFADIVLNQNINAKELRYSCSPQTRLLLGNRYVLLRSEFIAWKGWNRQIPERARHVLVTLGGADPNNVTLQIANALKIASISDIEVTVVAGASNPHLDVLKAAVLEKPSTMNLVDNVENMAELMAWADLAVSGGGSTCWELSFMKLPFITLVLADNQNNISNSLAKAGIAINCGWYYEMDSEAFAKDLVELINDKYRRLKMSEKAGGLIDGFGASRIIGAMLVKP